MFRLLVVGMVAIYIKTASTSYQRPQQEQHPTVKELRLQNNYGNGLSDDPKKVSILSPLQRYLIRANTQMRIHSDMLSRLPYFRSIFSQNPNRFIRKRSNDDLDIIDWVMDDSDKSKEDGNSMILFQESNSLEKPDSDIDVVMQKRPFDSISHSTVFDLFSKRKNRLAY